MSEFLLILFLFSEYILCDVIYYKFINIQFINI